MVIGRQSARNVSSKAMRVKRVPITVVIVKGKRDDVIEASFEELVLNSLHPSRRVRVIQQ